MICVAAAVVISATSLVGNVFAQGRTAPAAVKVGLIDMEEVFKNYEKFNALHNEFKTEMESHKAGLKSVYDRLQQTQKQLQDPLIKKGSPKYVELEASFTKQKAAFEAEVQTKNLKFKRREVEIYKTVYGEVQDMCEAYAKHYGYSLIMRFRRPTFDATDPEAIARDLASPVVYYNSGDDITEKIYKALNNEYRKVAGKKTSGVRQATGTTRSGGTPKRTSPRRSPKQ